jgi:hypothetical protein
MCASLDCHLGASLVFYYYNLCIKINSSIYLNIKQFFPNISSEKKTDHLPYTVTPQFYLKMAEKLGKGEIQKKCTYGNLARTI